MFLNAAIYSLTDRAFLLSNPIYHQDNFEMIINMLLENGYPLKLIFEKINNRLKTLIYNNNKHDNIRDPHLHTMTQNEKNNKKIIVFPYIKNLSKRVASVIDASKFTKGYRLLNSLRKFISTHKDRIDFYDNNNVVYKIKCKRL